jgi:hypothetical protein
MRWKILALLPCTLCGNLAFGQLPGGDTSTEATFDYLFVGAENGATESIAGSGTGPTSPISWNFVNSVESFPNPEGGSAQVSVFPMPWVSASASSLAPTGPGPTTGFGSDMNSTGTDIALQYYIQVDGPLSTTPITVFWNGTYSLTGATGPDGVTYVDATVGSSPEFLATCAVEAGCASGVTGAFTGNSLVLPTGTLHVEIAAAASSVNGGEAGFCYIDPYFYLSPTEVAA